MKAWHLCRNDKRLGYGDGRLIKTSRTYKVADPNKLHLCRYGLHASRRVVDALMYAQGSVLCRVELAGRIIEDKNKAVASERKVLWMFSCERLLHEFACKCAERALRKAKVEDHRCWAAIETKRAWLDGKVGDDVLAAARAAWAAWAAEVQWQNRTLLRMIRETRSP